MRVVVRDATLSFGATPVFHDFSATFETGTVTALVGPSGSGKSSLLAAMAGYQPLDSGSIEFVSDTPPTRTSPSPSMIAWVPQGSNALGRRTVLDNVLIAPLGGGSDLAEARERALDAIETVGLIDRVHSPARKLSGGELQRLGLARALASGRSVIFADEPSANLDAANTERIAALFDGLSSHATIIVATHDPLLVEAAASAVHLRSRTTADASS